MLVKLWDTKTGKVLFTLDSQEGTEVHLLCKFAVLKNTLFPY